MGHKTMPKGHFNYQASLVSLKPRHQYLLRKAFVWRQSNAMLRGDWEVSGNVELFQLGRSSDRAHMSLELTYIEGYNQALAGSRESRDFMSGKIPGFLKLKSRELSGSIVTVFSTPWNTLTPKIGKIDKNIFHFL